MGHNSQMHLTVSYALKVQKKWRKGWDDPNEFFATSMWHRSSRILTMQKQPRMSLGLAGPEQTRTKNDPWASYRIRWPRTLRMTVVITDASLTVNLQFIDQLPMHNCLQINSRNHRVKTLYPFLCSFFHSTNSHRVLYYFSVNNWGLGNAEINNSVDFP